MFGSDVSDNITLDMQVRLAYSQMHGSSALVLHPAVYYAHAQLCMCAAASHAI